MAELTSYKDTASSRHLRFKLQSLSRRLDELEEATKNLQKAEDELLDLQDKVIQAEGSNSSMLAEIEVLRQRVLRIEGKDEEIKRAEDLCQLMKEKLEEEENLTRELKSEIERLQKRMAELEKLEEAFSRSKNDCTQLCLSLNEERNLTKKISSELEMLRVKVKELESSEDRLDKTEQSLVSELEKLKSLTLSFVSERKYLNEKEKENEKLIKELTQKLEQNKKMNRDYTRNASNLLERNDLRIEDGISSTLPCKESRRKGSLDYLKQVENETRNKSENEKNQNQEDNKVKDLNQEIEKLKTQIKHFESLEEELKKMKAKNNDLQDNYLSEQNKNKLLASQLEEVKLQIKKQKELENGEVEGEDTFLSSKGRHERTKCRGHGNEAPVSKHTARELSPQHKRERYRNREFAFNNENYSLSNKQVSSPSFTNRRAAKAANTGAGTDSGTQETKRTEDRFVSGSSQSEGKKSREQPSVLSRYPPAAQEHNKVWKGNPKSGTESGLKGKVEKTTRTFSDTTHGSVPNDVSGRGDKASDTSTEALFGKRGQVTGNGSQITQAADSGSSKAIGALATSRRSSSEGLSKGKKAANGPEADTSLSNSKAPPLSKYYSSRSQENILQGFSTPSKDGIDQPVAVVMEDSGQHEALRCRVIKSSSREKPDSDDDMDMVSLVTAKLVNTTITPEPEPKQQPNCREKAKPQGGLRTSLFENDKDAGTESESGKSVRAPTNAVELPEANGAGVKSQRPFSPREALRSSPRATPGEALRERHTSTSNIQFTEAERMGDGPLKNRPETVVSRSSIIIKPSDPMERNSHAPAAETIRWKSHSAPLEVGSSDARHVTVRNAWKSRRDLNSLEDPPTRIGDAPELSSRRTQSSLTVSEVLTRRNRVGDAVSATAWNHSTGMEECDDCTLSVYRRLHNSLERSELSGKQGLPEPGRARAEERLRPSRPCAEEN
ncbi:leucine zipper protein 1 [Camelus ferus]|nr:leucine zipper protein 1 [Camelus ferus]